MDLFSETEQKNIASAAPLAVRMRPHNLEQFIGQESFIAPGKLLWRMLQADRVTSLIFYGPPGTGKTTLANVIANQCSAYFDPTNAAIVGVAKIREIIKNARDRLAVNRKRTVLFLDEIHRFSKSQQDVLLDDVENGTVILIGATTENPFFSVNSALVSRSTIFEFEYLTLEHIKKIITLAIDDAKRGLGQYDITMTAQALDYLAIMSNGDARKALTALEVGVLSQLHSQQLPGDGSKPAGPVKTDSVEIIFDLELAQESIQKKSLVSDSKGDSHYDLASALQKSMRGSDPDATVYWLARLIAGGEDPRFIARRICVTAAEDVGNADPMATILAASAMQIAEFVGFPEAQLPLAQAAIYIACAPKSNRSTKAIMSALSDVNNDQTAQVPQHLKDSHYPGAKKMGRGIQYKYPHSYPGAFVKQNYLPEDFAKQYYSPSDRGYEASISDHLEKLKEFLK
ncbi:MAG: replication-associated recombination protein A [Phycisphaerae bacterium]|nr:replication-associated recombination protein A [Phycisphaerae bacterium]